MRYALAALAALTLLAPSAWANWNVKAKITCYEPDNASEKLLKGKGGNADIIAACTGLSPTDPMIDNYAVTFDSDSRELHVILRCDDSVVVCDLSNQLGCAVAGQDDKLGINTKGVCVYTMLDVGKSDVQGQFVCHE